MQDKPSKSQSNQTPVPPPLTRNPISLLGWVSTLMVGTILLVLVGVDLLMGETNPYNSLVTYLVLPGFLMGGVALILLGAAWEWRRRHRKDPGTYPVLPTINLNLGWQRRRLVIGAILFSGLFTFSAVGVYRSYEFTESPEFCGEICHTVMKPEFTAYQHSPHARVSCAECHIGSGANWYVKSKMSGLRQVWAVATGTYNLPIKTPVHNLRPAQGTCEQCHWPAKFMNSVEKVIWHFSPDQVNTPMRTNLLLKIGGGSKEHGLGKGIHWHVTPGVTVRYWARDERRLDIPWVEVTDGDTPARVFKTEDCPDELPADAEIRTMDCIDCHNRPAHNYRSPRQLVDFSMANGVLDRGLPFLRRNAAELMEQQWPDTEAALAGIREKMTTEYAAYMQGEKGAEMVARNIEWLQSLYQTNFFPEQKVTWQAYPNHISHFEFPGCFRCHDGSHNEVRPAVSEPPKPISSDCNLCHTLLDQAEGEAVFGDLTFKGGDYVHPRGLGEIWKGRQCTECHGAESVRDVVKSIELQAAAH